MGNLQLDQLTMSDLNNLETAASQASSLVGTFNSTASDLMTKSNKLEQTARDLTLGSGGWVGQASLAFFGAWSRSKLDSLKCSAGLIRAAGTLDGLSKSIDQYVPTIRLGVQAHQEQQTNPPSNATIADHFDDLMQQGQNALFTLAGLIDQLASELEEAARELGVCSASDSQVDAYDLLAPPSLMNKASAEEDEAEMIALTESLEAQGVDSELAVDIALEAASKELDLKGVQALIDKGASPQEVLSLIKDGKITEANLGTLPLLLERSGGDMTITQIANRIQGLDDNQLALLNARASQNPKISTGDLLQLVDPQLSYVANPKHLQIRPGVGPEPVDGQAALDNSVSYKPTTNSRVGIDPTTGDIVVLDDTNDGTYHGHVETWQQLDQDQQNALKNAGFIDKRGRIIIRDSQGNIIGYGKNVIKGR